MIASLFIVFVVLILLRAPVSLSLLISTLVATVFFGDAEMFTGMISIVVKMFRSSNNFSLIAVPFFILAGGFMDSGGISRRLVNFSSALIGHIRGGLANASVMATAGSIGIVIPPSIPMIIPGVTAGISVSGLFMGGLSPVF